MGKKVMFLCDYQAPYSGNLVPSLMELNERLNEFNADAVYVFAEGARKYRWFHELKNSGKIVETCTFSKSKYSVLLDIQKLINKHNISILHSHFVSASVVEAFSLLNPKINVIIHIHSDFTAGINTWKHVLRDCLVYRILSKNVKFLSVSPAFVKHNPKKIRWLPNALASTHLAQRNKDGSDTRRMLGVRSNETLIELFGWSPNTKGVDIAVNAVKLVNESGQKVAKLAIICGKDMTPDRMREWINEHTNCNGQEPFLCYLEPTEDVFSYHAAADLLLSASRSEGFSYAILEMLSTGKRCVISDIPGVAWARKYSSVKCFKTQNVEDCAKAILEAVGELPRIDPEIANKIEQDYSIHNWINTILREYGVQK